MRRMELNPVLVRLIELLSSAPHLKGKSVAPFDVLETYRDIQIFDALPRNTGFDNRYTSVFGNPIPTSSREWFAKIFYPLNEFTLTDLILLMPDFLIANPEKVIQILNLSQKMKFDDLNRLKEIVNSLLFARKIVIESSAACLGGNISKGKGTQNLRTVQDWLDNGRNYELFMAVNMIPWEANLPKCLLELSEVHSQLVTLYPEHVAQKRFVSQSRSFSYQRFLLEGFTEKSAKIISSADALDLLFAVTDASQSDLFIDEYFLLHEIEAYPHDVSEYQILFINPSPFFVKKCLEVQANLPKIVFAIQDEDDLKLYALSKVLDRSKFLFIDIRDSSIDKRIKKRSIRCLVINSPQEVATPENISRVAAKWAPWLSQNCQVLFHLARPAAQKEAAEMLISGKRWLTLKHVITLPNGLPWNASGTRRRLIASYSYSRGVLEEDNIKLRHYSLIKTDDHRHFVYMGISQDVDASSKELGESMTLLQLLKRKYMRRNRKSVSSRFYFSANLFIDYNVYQSSDGSVYRTDKYLGYVLNGKNKRIPKTKVVVRSIDECHKEQGSLEQILLRDYPYGINSSVPDKKNALLIRDIANEACFHPLLESGEMTLKSFWFLGAMIERPWMDDTFGPEDIPIMKEMLDTAVGDILLVGRTLKEIKSTVDSVFEDESPSDKSDRMEMLRLLLELAVKKDYLPNNPLADLKRKSSSHRKARHQSVRAAMALKSFTTKQFQQIYAYIAKKVDQPEYLGALIALLTGLHPTEVSPLTWGDWMVVPDYGFTQLRIWRTRTNADEFTPMKSVYGYRLIPCGPLLAFCLQAHKKRLPANIAKNVIESVPILYNPQTTPEHLTSTWMKPERIRRTLREAVNSLNIEPDLMNIPEEEVAAKQTNLADARGIVRSNYEYLARNCAFLTEGELASILGRQPESVMAKSYISYDSDKSQYIMYRKAIRIEDLLFPIVKQKTVEQIKDKAIYLKAESKGTGVVNTTCRIQLQKHTEVRIKVKAAHGMRGVAFINQFQTGEIK